MASHHLLAGSSPGEAKRQPSKVPPATARGSAPQHIPARPNEPVRQRAPAAQELSTKQSKTPTIGKAVEQKVTFNNVTVEQMSSADSNKSDLSSNLSGQVENNPVNPLESCMSLGIELNSVITAQPPREGARAPLLDDFSDSRSVSRMPSIVCTCLSPNSFHDANCPALPSFVNTAIQRRLSGESLVNKPPQPRKNENVAVSSFATYADTTKNIKSTFSFLIRDNSHKKSARET